MTSQEIEVKSPTCIGCPFYRGENECMLPTNNPTPSTKSAREHYRSYFKTPCHRKWGEKTNEHKQD